MMNRTRFLITLMSCLLAICNGARGEDESSKLRDSGIITSGTAPDWAVIHAPSADFTSSSPGGLQWLLLDYQVNVGTEESYIHVARKVTTQNGVQTGSQVQFVIDPSYQHLTLHSLRIIREGQETDALDMAKLKVIQQEAGLERHLFDGTKTALIFLEDVRVGDVIDYSFTTRGFNPLLSGKAAGTLTMDWGPAIGRLFTRLRWPDQRKITIKNHSTTMEPEINSGSGFKDYRWERRNVGALEFEAGAPVSAEQAAWVQWSEFESWRDVARWAEPFYRVGTEKLPAELEEKIREWWKLPTPEQRARSALKFVQDEVRYLGIEMGAMSYQPNAPELVYQRRFGDCKDKANLYCAILDRLNINASTVLVNAYQGGAIADWAPSPLAFNHAIVQVEMGTNLLYLDPTRSFTGGELHKMFRNDFGKGLVIARNTTGLVTIPAPPREQTLRRMEETLRIVSYVKPAIYEVKLIYYGADADWLRMDLGVNGAKQHDKHWLNTLSKHYPKLTNSLPPYYNDNESQNIYTVGFQYQAPQLWELTQNTQKWAMQLVAQEIFDFALKPETANRRLPLALAYPFHDIHETRVYFPEAAFFPNTNYVVDDGRIRFERRQSFKDRLLVVTCDLQTLTNQVPVSGLDRHLETLKAIREGSYMEIVRPNLAAAKTGADKGINGMVIMVALLFGLMATAVALWIGLRGSKAPPPFATGGTGQLSGIGGWLGFVALGVCMNPLSILAVLARNFPAYSTTNWAALTLEGGSRYDPYYGPVLIFELLGNITLLVLATLNIFLFFGKRRIFPTFFVLLMTFSAVFLLIDHGFYSLIPESKRLTTNAEFANTFFTAMWYRVVFLIVWGYYMRKSVRVRNTFVN